MANLADNVREIVKEEYKKTTWEHGWPHVQRVAASARELASIVGADIDLCETAAYCHDLGRVVDISSPELANTRHANYSIPATFEILKKLQATEDQIGIIVGAVSVHADKVYSGKNPVAKVLRDCDKKDALGAWGTLRCFRHHLGYDAVDVEEIRNNMEKVEILEDLAKRTVQIVRKDPEKLGTYLNNLNFVLEWIEGRMLDNPPSYDFLKKEYIFSRDERTFLVADFVEALSQKSSSIDKQRASHFFHDPFYEGLQFGLNVIQPGSYIRPHARRESERIILLEGKVCFLQFDSSGKLARRNILNEKNPFLELECNSFNTALSLERNSAIGITVRGPLRKDYRADAQWAPSEQENHDRFFDYLKSFI